MNAQQMWNSYQPYAAYGYAYPYGVPSFPPSYVAPAPSAPGMPYTYAQAAYAGGYAQAAPAGFNMNVSNGRYDGTPLQANPNSNIAYTQGPPTKKRLTSEAQLSTSSTPIHSHSYYPTSATASSHLPSTESAAGASKKEETSAATSSSSPGAQWPPSLLAYVTRCYEQTEKSQHPVMEKKLAEMIKLAEQTKTLWTRDWANVPLPMSKSKTPKASVPEAAFNMSFPQAAEKSSSKSKQPKSKLASASHLLASPTQLSATKSTARPSKGIYSAGVGEISGDVDDDEKREMRASRFRDVPSSSTPRYSDYSNGEYDAGDGTEELATIMGTNTALEKPYLRLTERPLPSMVRPVHVLKRSLELMRRKKREGASWTNYLGEQMKSIRQDLVIQAVTDEFALEVYETNARWCLENNDVAEFKRCLLRIEEFYNHLDISSPHMDEFYCYSLLYNLLSEDFPALNAELATLKGDRRTHEAILHAVRICEAYIDNNWHAFFRLAKRTYFLEKHILDVASERLRSNALKSILVSYVCVLRLLFASKVSNSVHFDEKGTAPPFQSSGSQLSLHFNRRTSL